MPRWEDLAETAEWEAAKESTEAGDVAAAWDEHRRNCWRCSRQWRKWEDGEMTCEVGVPLLLAVLHAQHVQETLL